MSEAGVVTMKVSIIIKALNEEKNIARAIESSINCLEKSNVDSYEVILADSLSTDKTIDIAQNYPVKIIQLTDPEDRSCGVGAELGYYIAEGEYLYILDADMEFIDGFFDAAIEFLEKNLSYAGVGGLVQEMNNSTIEFQQRYLREGSTLISSGDTFALNMGGLYRKSSIDKIGYFTNKNLNSYEETELGARLVASGEKLYRLGVPSVKHYGHTINSYKLILKRIKTGYILGFGELIRSSFGKDHFYVILKNLKQVKLYLVYFLWLCLLLGLLIYTLFIDFDTFLPFIGLLILPLIGMSIKKRSLKIGFYSVFSSVVNSLATFVGLLSSPDSKPAEKVPYRQLK